MDFELFSNISTALSNSNRLQIVMHIAENGDDCAQSLLKVFNISQPTMSQHLKILRQAKIIKVRKSGRWQFFRINTDVMREYLEFTQSQIVEVALKSEQKKKEKAKSEE